MNIEPNAFMMAFALAIASKHGTYARENIDIAVTNRPYYVCRDFHIEDLGNVMLPVSPNIEEQEMNEITLTLRMPAGPGSFLQSLRAEYETILNYHE